MDIDKSIDDIISENIEPTKDELDTFKSLYLYLNIKSSILLFNALFNVLNTQNGRIKASVKTTHKPINIKEIRTMIENNKDMTGEELLNILFNKEERPVMTKKVIKRIVPKVSLSLDI